MGDLNQGPRNGWLIDRKVLLSSCHRSVRPSPRAVAHLDNNVITQFHRRRLAAAASGVDEVVTQLYAVEISGGT